jgi:hypothetical protein
VGKGEQAVTTPKNPQAEEQVLASHHDLSFKGKGRLPGDDFKMCEVEGCQGPKPPEAAGLN